MQIPSHSKIAEFSTSAHEFAGDTVELLATLLCNDIYMSLRLIYLFKGIFRDTCALNLGAFMAVYESGRCGESKSENS